VTISLTNSGAGLFDRLGKLGIMMLNLHALEGGTATANVASGASMITLANALEGYYGLAVQNRKVLDGMYAALSGWQSGQSGFCSALRTIAQNTLIEMANDDSALPQKTVAAAMVRLIEQMKANSQTVNASTVSVGSQTAVGTVTGDPAIVVAARRPSGQVAEMAFAETLRFTCTSDKGTGATEDREPYLVSSPVAVSDATQYNWPAGSGISQSLTAIDASQDASGNLLTNSDWETNSSNTFTGWDILVGTTGTDILAATSTDAYNSSSYALQFKENSGTLPSVTQTFGTGTSSTLKPNTVYLVNSYMKRSAALTGNGTVEIGLVDGSNALLTDDAGNSVKFTQVASSLATSYGKVSGVLVTPSVMPTTTKLRVRMSVAIADSGKSVYIDNLAMALGTELYTGGPYAAVFAGATAPKKSDAWTIAISNSMGAFVALFERFFGMKALGVQLPSDAAAGETLVDGLIV
jgi:hypothetical protein